jgi:hypothetical protein
LDAKICLGPPNLLLCAANIWVSSIFCNIFSCRPVLSGYLLLTSPSGIYSTAQKPRGYFQGVLDAKICLGPTNLLLHAANIWVSPILCHIFSCPLVLTRYLLLTSPFGMYSSMEKPKVYFQCVLDAKICLGPPNLLPRTANIWVSPILCHIFICQPVLSGHLLLTSPSGMN